MSGPGTGKGASVLKLVQDARSDRVPRPAARPGLPPVPEAPRPSRRSGPVARLLRETGPETLVVLLGLAVFGWGVGVPGPWRDESATMVIADRSASQILELTGNIDLVHLAYYLIAHAVLGLVPGADPDTALVAVRWVSVVAVALTAGVMVRIGRQLGSAFTGTTAALMLVASPLATRYAQEARSYALVMLAGACATLALLYACRRPWRRGWMLYSLAIGATALLNVLSLLLLVVVHAVHVLVSAPGAVRRRWFTCTGTTMLFLAPYVMMTFRQRTQVSWIVTPPDLDLLRRFLWIEYENFLVPLAVVAVAAGALLAGAVRRASAMAQLVLLPASAARPSLAGAPAARVPVTVAAGLRPLPVGQRVPPPALRPAGPRLRDREGVRALTGLLGSGPHRGAFLLGLNWALVPPVLLWCVSQAHPLFTYRYIVFSLPGTALLLASLAPLLRPLGALLPLLAVALSGAHMQSVYRDPVVGHGEDVTGVTRHIASHAMESDGLLFITEQMRLLPEQYPERFRGLKDLVADRGPIETASIVGTEVMPETVGKRIEGHTRIWVITGPDGLAGPKTESDAAKVASLARDYRISEHTSFLKIEVFLFTLVPTPSAEGPVPAPVGVPEHF